MIDKIETCRLCDGHYSCDNCYWGQIDLKENLPACSECDPFGAKLKKLG